MIARDLTLAIAFGMAAGGAAPAANAFELDEARLGINMTGIELWTWQPYSGAEEYRALDTIEAELLFTLPNDTLLSYLGNPSINIGGHLSMLDRASMVRAGLTWGGQLFETPFFLEGTLAAALTNSTLSGAVAPDRNVGCPVLAYFAANLGYRLSESWSVMGTVYHASHASLCGLGVPNRGLNGYGIKVGYAF